MAESIEREIASLPKMNIAQLRARWQQRLEEPVPVHVRKQLFVPILAYKLQEQAYGGLKPEVRRQLEELAATYRQNTERKTQFRVKAGTRLLREWNGKTHQVTAVEDGFEYQGHCYKSLSVIARIITGTRWSGPLFFGLKAKRR